MSHAVILATVDNASRRRGFVVMNTHSEARAAMDALSRKEIKFVPYLKLFFALPDPRRIGGILSMYPGLSYNGLKVWYRDPSSWVSHDDLFQDFSTEGTEL